MSRTYRTARTTPASAVTTGRIIRENNRRPWSRAWKKLIHHQDRRAASRVIAGELQEVS